MIKIIQPTTRPELSKTPGEWRNSSSTPALSSKCGTQQNSCASDSEIAEIDAMMNDGESVQNEQPRQPIDRITVEKGLGLRAPVAITPEKAAELMIANYCRQNGGVIVDNKKPNQVILG